MNKITDIIFIQNYYWANIGVMSISAVLKQNGFKTDVVIGKPDLILKKIQFYKPRVVGFYSTTGYHHIQLGIARKIKSIFGDKIITLFGGPHPTFDKSILMDSGVDIICKGEGEYAVLELLEALKRKSDYTAIKNLSVKINGLIYDNPLRPPCELDCLPISDREVYASVPAAYLSKQYPVMFSRGCPYSCSFCSAPAVRKLYQGRVYLRLRSINNMIQELKEIKLRYKPKQFYFYDENFFQDKNYTINLLEEYKKKVNIPYICMMRADLMNDEVSGILKESGCFFTVFGIESGNQEVRNSLLNKQLSDESIVSCAESLRKYRINFATLNIVGLPGETISHVWDAVRINSTINPRWAKFFVYQTLPATKLGEYSLKNGYINRIDVMPSDASMFNSGIIVRQNKEFKKIIRLKSLANIYIKSPLLRKSVGKIMLNLPLSRLYVYIEKLLEFLYYYASQMYKWSFFEKVAIAVFYIKHRKEFE